MRFYDHQTWPADLFEKATRCAKVCGLFFLDCAFWMLIGQANSDHMDGASLGFLSGFSLTMYRKYLFFSQSPCQ